MAGRLDVTGDGTLLSPHVPNTTFVGAELGRGTDMQTFQSAITAHQPTDAGLVSPATIALDGSINFAAPSPPGAKGTPTTKTIGDLTTTVYPNGTVESHNNKDGTGTWITEGNGLRTTTSIDIDGKVHKSSVGVDGNLYDRGVGNPNAIGTIADKMAEQKRAANGAAPAADPYSDKGSELLKTRNPKLPQEYLLMPNAPISGIEDHHLTEPGAANYFAQAWDTAREKTAEALGKTADTMPRDAIALAVNSADWRSQDRLHIHSDVIDPKLANQLRGQVDNLDGQFKQLPFSVHGHSYDAMFMAGDKMPDNPVKLVYDRLAAQHGEQYAKDHMAEQSIVVVGETKSDGSKGFVVLNTQVKQDHSTPNSYNGGFGEEWLKGHSDGDI